MTSNVTAAAAGTGVGVGAGAGTPSSPGVTVAVTPSERRSKRPSTRPALQIYRPPGLRSSDENSTNTKPSPTAGAKQLKKDVAKKHSEDNNNNTSESGKCANTLNGCTRRNTDDNANTPNNGTGGEMPASTTLQRADSALSSESAASSQASSTKSPNSTSRRRHHHHHPLGENVPPPCCQPHAQPHHYHHQHHHYQLNHQPASATAATTTCFKPNLKRSGAAAAGGGGGVGGSGIGGTRSSPALLRMDGITGFIGIGCGGGGSGANGGGTQQQQHGTTANSEKSGSGRSTPLYKSVTATTPVASGGREQQQNANKKKQQQQMNGKEIEELTVGLRKLNLTKDNSLIEKFITSNFEDEEVGGAVGQMLVHFSIEENRQAGKAVARIAAQLLGCGAANVFHQGTVVALMHYFECRDRLRIDHFRVWIAFLNFVSDLYANVGYIYEGELVDLVFRIFGYMLKAPVLDTLKIEELESLIGCLLSVGYDLERQCPEQLAVLKDLIRDAFIEVQEPWARKMILLLMELGASGWKLPPEANEYYFQQTSS